MADQTHLDDLASAVAEGSRIDWGLAEQSARDGSELALVRELQVLSKMADVVRTPGAPAELQVGQLWGHLRISAALAAGSFGSVYRAWDTRLACEVALKVIKPSGVSPAFDLSRVIKEARLLARLRHRNVVRVFGADSHDGNFGLWMELIPGRTLEQQLTMQGPMGVSEAIPIGIDLCHALAAVHSAGLIHRDVKAHNVLREEGGRIVLMDFGTGGDTQEPETADTLAGTPLYLAPELFQHEKPSAQSDIYSLGVLLYHLVTGDYPVQGKTRVDLESAHRTGKRQPLRDVRPDLSPVFINVLERALARNPADRYRSAGEFGNALASAAGVSFKPDLPKALDGWRQWKWLAVATAAVAVLVVGFSASQRWMARPEVGGTREAGVDQPITQSPPATTSSPANASYDVAVSFYASRNGSDVRLTQGSRVRLGDELFAVINTSQPVFVYIVNRDEAGKTFLLFPLSEFSEGKPISHAQMVRLPGTKDGQQLFWKVTSVGGQEHFFLYVTPQRLVEFEQLLASLPRAELGRTVDSLPLSTSAIGVLRGVGGLSAVSSAAPSTGNELAELPLLSDQNESAVGVWARQVSFQNPPEQ